MFLGEKFYKLVGVKQDLFLMVASKASGNGTAVILPDGALIAEVVKTPVRQAIFISAA